jgi:hypothetical protein
VRGRQAATAAARSNDANWRRAVSEGLWAPGVCGGEGSASDRKRLWERSEGWKQGASKRRKRGLRDIKRVRE